MTTHSALQRNGARRGRAQGPSEGVGVAGTNGEKIEEKTIGTEGTDRAKPVCLVLGVRGQRHRRSRSGGDQRKAAGPATERWVKSAPPPEDARSVFVGDRATVETPTLPGLRTGGRGGGIFVKGGSQDGQPHKIFSPHCVWKEGWSPSKKVWPENQTNLGRVTRATGGRELRETGKTKTGGPGT